MKPTFILSLAILATSCAQKTVVTGKAPTPVKTAEVETFTPAGGERYSASIVPDRVVTVMFRVNGVVESIPEARGGDGRMRALQTGDNVSEGDVLGQVRQKDYDYQVNQATGNLTEARRSEEAARSQVAQAEAGAAKAGGDFERATFLFSNKSLTKPDYDAAKAQLDASKAQVEAARAQTQAIAARIGAAQAAVDAITLTRSDTVLRAPIGGTIVQRNIEKGGVTGPSAAAYVIADINTVKAVFGVPDVAVVHIKPGAHLALEVEALPGRRFNGVISTIAPVADSSTRLFQVEVAIPNADRVLRPGMIAGLSLSAAAKTTPVPVVPLSAIVRSPQSSSAFAVMTVEAKVVHRRTVTLGETYGDRVEITGGVAAGDQVISQGASAIEDGEKVEVIP